MNLVTLRNVKVSQNLFKDIYEYDHGGYSYEYLDNDYVHAYPYQNDHVGRITFSEFITLLKKHGEAKDFLSTYYISFKYAYKTFVEIMNRLRDLEYTEKSLTNKIIDITKKCTEIEQFVSYEHSTQHLSLNTDDVSHCFRFALGGICERSHSQMTFQQFSDVVSFLNLKLIRL